MSEPSRLDQALSEIGPEERRVLERIAEPELASNRWFKVQHNFDVGPVDLFRWVNRPRLMERPTATHHCVAYRGVRSVPTPVVRFSGPTQQHSDYYKAGDGFFLSERLFDVFQKLDPESVEWIEVDASGTSERYFYCLCIRSLRAIDERTTTLVLGPGQVVAFGNDGFAIADEAVPRTAHCFVLYHSVGPLWSRELVDAVIASGAKGLTFWPPFVSVLAGHSIRI